MGNPVTAFMKVIIKSGKHLQRTAADTVKNISSLKVLEIAQHDSRWLSLLGYLLDHKC